ncbi:hypothetical protein Q2T41_09345 [Maribacter confluentis]|uniref:Uncharacterized protein n=1 Tax=Maribacter confluentis TaxID=1656093 RepID=A0ABT8RPL6_9FLAO|nr:MULTISPECIES: hypothetical protein [Maribacter]MDO1512858.1 hypothetical protein [Maribacter confluentis]CAG2534729.1 hypothetical protein MAR621_00552 [Maribacter dokdonensis]
MAAIHIIQYRAGWDLNNNYGILQLRSQNGTWSSLKKINDPNEFQVIMDLLRNEHPIFHDTKSDVIRTTNEDIGDNE